MYLTRAFNKLHRAIWGFWNGVAGGGGRPQILPPLPGRLGKHRSRLSDPGKDPPPNPFAPSFRFSCDQRKTLRSQVNGYCFF